MIIMAVGTIIVIIITITIIIIITTIIIITIIIIIIIIATVIVICFERATSVLNVGARGGARRTLSVHAGSRRRPPAP